MREKCPNVEENLKNCTCTYEPCSRKGVCCECIMYHKRIGEIPGCLFTSRGERTFDRTVNGFIKDQS